MSKLLKHIFIIVLFALPLLEHHVFNVITSLYKSIFDAKIFSIIDVSNIGIFNAYSIFSAISITCIAIYAFLIRTFCGIETNLKKLLFTIGFIFYLIPFQVALLSICVCFLENRAEIDWGLLRLHSASVYLSTLAMSLWVYRIIVSRKNSTFKCALLVLANILLLTSAFIPYIFESHLNSSVYIAFFVMLLWLATVTDIIFEGFGYKITKQFFCKKND